MTKSPQTEREEFEKIIKDIMQCGFDVAMGGDIFKDEEENKRLQEEKYNEVISIFTRKLLTKQHEALAQQREEIIDFPKLIKETRKMLGENQTIFGARFGLPHHSISYYESGTYEAPYSVIQFCINSKLTSLKDENSGLEEKR